MRMNKKAFTLVEMLFVVVIALMALGFSAYKLKEMKVKGYEKGATGFLVDIASAKAAMTADLAREGFNLDACIRDTAQSGITENIEITTAGVATNPAEVAGKTLREYLEENHCSKESVLKAMELFGYIKYGINTVGNNKYYIYAGFPISNQCGTMTQEMNDHTVAYMCGVARRSSVHPAYEDDTRCQIDGGYSFLDNGSIVGRGSGNKPKVLTEPNPCDTANGAVLFRCSPMTQQYTWPGYYATCPLTAPFYGIGSPVVAGTPEYANCENTGNPSAPHGSACTTTCTYDTTVANNTQSDTVDGAEMITIVDPDDGTEKTISCYEYWHFWGSTTYR